MPFKVFHGASLKWAEYEKLKRARRRTLKHRRMHSSGSRGSILLPIIRAASHSDDDGQKNDPFHTPPLLIHATVSTLRSQIIGENGRVVRSRTVRPQLWDEKLEPSAFTLFFFGVLKAS